MAISTDRLAQALAEVKTAYPSPAYYDNTAYFVLLDLMRESLAPMERRIYDYVIFSTEGGDQTVTARDVADHFSIEVNHASTVLKQLADWGLLSREAVTTESGKEYRYRG